MRRTVAADVRYNEAVKRNRAKIRADFMFALTQDEWAALRSQIATFNPGRGQHRKYLPYAFTEHSAIMAGTVLSSPRAIEVSVYVVRASVRVRVGRHTWRPCQAAGGTRRED